MANMRPGGASRTVRLSAASAIGTTLEWYDFTIYNTLAALIFNELFFPSFDPWTGTILAFSTYAVGYVSRPFGGVVFGHLGDRRGRRFVLVVTLVLMGLTTAAIGLLPTYASIGLLSPVLLVALRFLQGVALGGEWAGAVLISVEHGDQRRRGRNASWTQVGPAAGVLMATAFIGLITYVLAPADFLRWGWRIPPLTSIVIVLVGMSIRKGIDETPMFERLAQTGARAARPIGEVVRHHWRRLLIAGGVRIGSDVFYALVFVFTLTYVTSVLKLSRTLALTAIATATPFNAIGILWLSGLSDRVGRRPVYAAGAVAGMIWTFLFFVLLDTRHPAPIVLAVIVGALIHAAMYGPQASFVIEQFPTRVRYAGSSLAYTLAGILGGGFAPLIIATLFRVYGTTTAISAYVVGALVVTCLALLVARETAGAVLED